MRFITKLQFWLLTGIATYLTLSPAPGAVFENIWDKALHLVCWGGLSGSLFIYQQSAWKLPCTINQSGYLYLFIYSCLLEVLQYFVPGRYFSTLDMLANSMGIIIALCIIYGTILPLSRYLSTKLSPRHDSSCA